MVRLAVGQMAPSVETPEGNIPRIKAILKQASDDKIEVLVLPELCNSGYAFANREEAYELSEVIGEGRASQVLMEWSKKSRMVVAGICERTEEGLFNSAAVFADGEHIVTYRKLHLFLNEKDIFIPGNVEPPVVQFKGDKYGVMMCFDWAFPEVARVLALKGAEVILHPANLVLPYCQKAMLTRSIENRIFTATANRVGTERGLTFTGNSQITNPKGELLRQMSSEKAGVTWSDIKPADARNKMISERNDLFKDRRPKVYTRIIGNQTD